MPSEDTTSTVNQSHNEHADQPARLKNKKILLMLPEELQKKMKGTLRNRFNTLDVIVPVETLSMKEEEQNKFQWLLKFPWDFPETKDHQPPDPRHQTPEPRH